MKKKEKIKDLTINNKKFSLNKIQEFKLIGINPSINGNTDFLNYIPTGIGYSNCYVSNSTTGPLYGTTDNVPDQDLITTNDNLRGVNQNAGMGPLGWQ